MRRFLVRFRRDDRGATAIEYGLIAALIFLIIVTAVNAVGTETGAIYETIKTEVTAALS